MRQVVDGERLSGHSGTESCPEIVISDGQGPGGGALICAISCFHWAEVEVKGDTTVLWFEDKTRLTIDHGLVEYAEASETGPA
jgi:hypothetical protein